MDKFFKPFALAAGVCAMILLADVPKALVGVSFVRDAEAVVVVRGGGAVAAAVVVGAVVVASSSANKNAAAQANANASAQQANQAAAQANQAAAEANKAATEAKAATDTKAAAATAQPAVGTIVTTLPAGCTQTKLNNVDYMRCGSTYYKPGMVGDTVVFVVAQP